MKKTAIATAVGAAFALTSGLASAAPVETWQLEDYNSDGLSSDFAFYSPPSGSSANQFAAGAGDGAPIAMNTGEIGTNVFTTGFNFGGTGIFAPFIGNAAGTGNIDADITGGALTFSALDFAGIFGGTNFFLPPDGGVVNVETLDDLGSGNFGVVVRYVGTIDDPGGSFDGFAANWRLEGTMSIGGGQPPEPIPVPAAVWLFGSGLVGLVGVARRKRNTA